MNPRPLILSDEVREDIHRVIAYAEAHRYNIHDVFQMMKGRLVRPPPGDDPGHVANIPMGYRCVFSIMQQPEPTGWTRHLSVSVDECGMCPSQESFFFIAALFGFTWNGEDDPPPDTVMHLEDIPGDRKAIHLIQSLVHDLHAH